jgi:GNAT superfamily N-acetyltransferase
LTAGSGRQGAIVRAICLHDKTPIESFLRRDTFLHIYGLGDLDDRFWPFTTWYALTDGEEIKAIVLVYTGLARPVVLALGSKEEAPFLQELLRSITSLLPECFHAHLSLGLAETLQGHYRLESRGEHYKMALTDASRLAEIDTSQVVSLSTADVEELIAFYAQSYPGHSFEPSMLDTGQCCGMRGPDGLISVAGVHVYSEAYKVAAPANIATHPEHRGRGYGAAVTAGLCKNLLNAVAHVGLNVKADNEAALRCYARLGFEAIGSYEELSARRA